MANDTAAQPPQPQREEVVEAAACAIAETQRPGDVSIEAWMQIRGSDFREMARAAFSILPAAASVEAGERAQIVAWLRDLAENHEKPFGLVEDYGSRWTLKHAADAIERGDHVAAKGGA